MPSQNFHHSVTFILPLSQNRHSTHRSVTFILPSCQNSHRTHCVMKEPIRFLTYTIRNFNRTFNEQIVNFLQIPSYMNVFRWFCKQTSLTYYTSSRGCGAPARWPAKHCGDTYTGFLHCCVCAPSEISAIVQLGRAGLILRFGIRRMPIWVLRLTSTKLNNWRKYESI